VSIDGVCISKDGRNDCSADGQSKICYSPDPQYTDEAAKANVKGTVRLSASIDANGCANNIKVVSSLGFGLDDSAVFAVERWRFRKPAKPTQVVIELNFEPKFSPRHSVTAPKCLQINH
jgi:TonB family protein